MEQLFSPYPSTHTSSGDGGLIRLTLHPKTIILKAIKNTTGRSVIFPINISLIHFVCVLTSVPNEGECLTKT